MTSLSERQEKLFQRRPLRRALRNWLERHQHPVNFWIHMAGIPLAFAGIALFFMLPWSEWYWALAAFVAGYCLQWIGHRVEGNDMGEWAGIKRLLGLPYVAIAPGWRKGSPTEKETSRL
jgi:uncharacterized membrane protein YGL010W